MSTAMDELQYLMNFNSSISQAAAKTMEHLTKFVFTSMGNLTLACRDTYLTHLKTGVQPDTMAALRTAPVHISTLFPDNIIKKAEEEIVHYESKGHSSASRGKGRYHPKELIKGRTGSLPTSRIDQHVRILARDIIRKPEANLPSIPHDQPRASSPINDNYCVDKLQEELLAGSQPSIPRQTMNTQLNSHVNFHVLKVDHAAPGHSQRKEISPGAAVCYQKSTN